MKIGVMLRHYEQQEGGVKVYTKRVLPLLFTMGKEHEYVLIYQNPKLIGTYAQYPNVKEVAATLPGSVTWDQIAVPWVARRERVELIFNPKFTIPFFTRAKKVFVLHGSEWFVIPEHFKKYDQFYFNRAVPLYCKHSDAFIAVSNAVKADVVRYIGVDPAKVTPIHNGFDPGAFQPVRDPAKLQAVREKYRLPERFILWAGQIESRKNIARLLEAFARIRNEFPHHLVLAGAQRWSTDSEMSVLKSLGIENRLDMPGWIDHTDLPAVYCLADQFAFPSLYEGFGIPLLEAMACGCPIVTATTCAPPEVCDGAARLVDPLDVDDIAAGMREVLSSEALRAKLSARGLERVKDFGWEKCVREILALFNRLAPRS
ncbi:MAG TPA: glycosyltransferase family 1 protein [Steroidobacteraceae bacterium]|nr:glycosyltransferase family 1 protein [Steroidobacteraceae bacterium]